MQKIIIPIDSILIQFYNDKISNYFVASNFTLFYFQNELKLIETSFLSKVKFKHEKFLKDIGG
jgi:hypothetical protein